MIRYIFSAEQAEIIKNNVFFFNPGSPIKFFDTNCGALRGPLNVVYNVDKVKLNYIKMPYID